MRKLTRVAVIGALAAPLLMLASAGAASADESSFCKQRTSATEYGAWTESACSRAETDGDDFGNGFDNGFDNDGLLGGLLGGIL